jgi:hypothetical protein
MKVSSVATDNKRIDKVENRLGQIEADVAVLKTDVAILKSDVKRIDTKLDSLIDNLTEWKSQVFNALDVFMVETKDQRDFRTMGSHQINDNTDRIERLEKKVFGSMVA